MCYLITSKFNLNLETRLIQIWYQWGLIDILTLLYHFIKVALPVPLLNLFINNNILNSSQCGGNQTNDQWNITQHKSQGDFLCVEELAVMCLNANELFSITGSHGSDVLESLTNS